MYPQPPLNIQGRCPICRGAVNFWNFHPWILDHCFLFENLHYTLSDLLDGLVRRDCVSYELPNLAISYARIWSCQATCLNLLVCWQKWHVTVLNITRKNYKIHESIKIKFEFIYFDLKTCTKLKTRATHSRKHGRAWIPEQVKGGNVIIYLTLKKQLLPPFIDHNNLPKNDSVHY